VKLPEGVEKKTIRKKNGKAYTYYYWNPGRGTDREGDRIKLPNPEKNLTAFSQELDRLQKLAPTSGSIGDLVHRFQSSNHIRRPGRVCRTKCERRDPG